MTQPPFSTHIKDRRLELHLSLKEASKRTGIQPSRLHDLETGINSTTGKPTGPTRENIRQLARGYQLPEDYLHDLAGRPSLTPSEDDERLLLAHFRLLSPGHRAVVLSLVDDLQRLDHSPQ